MFSRHLYHCHPVRTIISHQSYYNTLLTSFPFYILALLQYSPPTSSHQGMNLLKTLECLLFLNIRSFRRLQVPTRSGPASFSNHLPPWTRVRPLVSYSQILPSPSPRKTLACAIHFGWLNTHLSFKIQLKHQNIQVRSSSLTWASRPSVPLPTGLWSDWITTC